MSILHNPILPGFYPDPSLCRAGNDYFLVTSSFEYFPGVPIFHSQDLVNWTQIGHCLTRKSQLNLDRCCPSGGIFAPTIRFHEGTFYMVTTNVSSGGNFYVTTRDPHGSWSEPIYIDEGYFDPSLLFDDDGKVYYTRRQAHGILQAEIDITTGKLLTPLKLIVEKFICTDIEGPHLYKIHGKYYLMAAEGGSRFGHAEVIGRSDHPWGPFKPCPDNPIVTHRDQGHLPIRDTGHAELIEDQQGNWWFFCLGTRQKFYDAATLMGRETFLAPVVWEDGWPKIEGKQVTSSFQTVWLPPAKPRPAVMRDDFDKIDQDHCWNYLRNPTDENYSLSERAGFLRLKGSAITLNEWDSPTFVGRRQENFSFKVSCSIEFHPQFENEEAGLTVFMTNEYHYDLCLVKRGDLHFAALKKRVGDMTHEQIIPLSSSQAVTLIITSDGASYQFLISSEGNEIHVGSGIAKLISSEIAAPANGYPIWTGIYLGLYATGNGKRCTAHADFDWFEYIPLQEGSTDE
jgi:xylan 1,4-beta-xylosidase